MPIPRPRPATWWRWARAYGSPEGRLGVGVADSDVLGALEPALARHGLRAFNPAGRPRRAEGLHALLSALSDLARAPSWSACATVLRCPDVLAWLAGALPETSAPERLLAEVDALGEQHLPPDLTAALLQAAAHPRRFGTVKPALQALHDLRRRLVGGTFSCQCRGRAAGPICAAAASTPARSCLLPRKSGLRPCARRPGACRIRPG